MAFRQNGVINMLRASVVIIITLISAAAVAAYFFYLTPAALTANVRRILEGGLNADISVGSASLRPITGLTVKGVSVRSRVSGRKIFSAGKIGIRPRWLSLLAMRFRIRELSLDDAELVFSRDASGYTDWRDVLREAPETGEMRPPVFTLKNGRIMIGGYVIRGLSCELTPFPSEKTIAFRGSVRDPFWGDYSYSGDISIGAKTLALSFGAKDLHLTEAWVSRFPLIGRDAWDKYRPAGLFDLAGNITYCWGKGGETDYSLVFTGKDASCRYLIFPVTGATGRILIDPASVVVNHLKGELFKGEVEGYSIASLEAPFTYFSRYSFTEVDMAEFLKDYQPGGAQIQGRGSGSVFFNGDHSLGTFDGQGEISVPDARFWKFPVILQIISYMQLRPWAAQEPLQNCRFVFSLSGDGITFKEISLASDVMDICGEGWSSYDGELKLSLYARPVTKTPILIADILLQQALDSLSGKIAQFEVTGTLAKPNITIIPLTPVRKNIVNFFDALTNQRLQKPPKTY